MLDFIFNRGKKDEEAPSADGSQKAADAPAEGPPGNVLDVGLGMKGGEDALVGDCRSNEGSVFSPCTWSVQKASKGQAKYRVIV
jgi:hypothetical protein